MSSCKICSDWKLARSSLNWSLSDPAVIIFISFSENIDQPVNTNSFGNIGISIRFWVTSTILLISNSDGA